MFQTDRAQFDVTVNGVPMMIGAELLQELHLIEHAHTNKPSLVLNFVDNKQAARGWGTFQDGATIQLSVGNGQQPPLQFSFRQFGIDNLEPRSAGDLIHLSGVADAVPWFTKVVTKAHKGNASDVLRELAQMGGISLTDLDATQDHMTWLPDAKTISQFARRMVDHAWIGQQASPLMVLTSQNGQWMLRLKDIMKKGSPTVQLVSHGLPQVGQSGVVPVWTHVIKTHGGALNGFVNYGYQLINNTLGGSVEKFFQIDINSLTSFIGISQGLSQTVGVARQLYAAAAIGNTHDKYWQARHANTKSRAAYTSEVSVLVTQQTGLKILDDVTALLANSTGQQDAAFSGQYKVSGITRSIRRGSYMERITLTSQGVNALGGGLQT